MKRMSKKLVSLMLALVMTLSMAMSVCAAPATAKSTVQVPIKAVVSAAAVDGTEDEVVFDTTVTVNTDNPQTLLQAVEAITSSQGLSLKTRTASDGTYIEGIDGYETVNKYPTPTSWVGEYWKVRVKAGDIVTEYGDRPSWAAAPPAAGGWFDSLLAPSNLKLGVENNQMYTWVSDPAQSTGGFKTDTVAVELIYVHEEMSW